MKRLFQFLRNASTVLSLLLCLASAGFWVRSYRVHDAYPMLLTGNGYKVETWWGRLLIARCRIDHPPPNFLVRIEMANIGTHHANYATTAMNIALNNHMELPNAIELTAPKISFDESTLRNGLGFGYSHSHFNASQNEGAIDFSAVSIPLWIVCLLSAILGLLQIARWRRNSRKARLSQAGRCQSCGYDLRATPHRCPECGALPAIQST